jgi:DeoR/GlpR family transcriptional regulator of sugar metabolism
VEQLYQQGFTMEVIATQLGVSVGTIHHDLRNLSAADKLKPAKTASSPKGVHDVLLSASDQCS